MRHTVGIHLINTPQIVVVYIVLFECLTSFVFLLLALQGQFFRVLHSCLLHCLSSFTVLLFLGLQVNEVIKHFLQLRKVSNKLGVCGTRLHCSPEYVNHFLLLRLYVLRFAIRQHVHWCPFAIRIGVILIKNQMRCLFVFFGLRNLQAPPDVRCLFQAKTLCMLYSICHRLKLFSQFIGTIQLVFYAKSYSVHGRAAESDRCPNFRHQATQHSLGLGQHLNTVTFCLNVFQLLLEGREIVDYLLPLLLGRRDRRQLKLPASELLLWRQLWLDLRHHFLF
mmetsp:Transcript_44475/g.96774  ORF Transcript_44475/g.96774 Transcript_44475/m.96774 type:complete len:279 (+) Transcript_44475:415-1251(+)